MKVEISKLSDTVIIAKMVHTDVYTYDISTMSLKVHGEHVAKVMPDEALIKELTYHCMPRDAAKKFVAAINAQ